MNELETEELPYRDDRMFVMRLTTKFTKDEQGAVTASLEPDSDMKQDAPVILITYRNTLNLPAIRIDEFPNLPSAIAYIRKAEPTCPRLSLNVKSPWPEPSWEEHLHWLHSQDLMSAAEGDNPCPQGTSDSANRREVIFPKQKL